jgi:hypothetical protein
MLTYDALQGGDVLLCRVLSSGDAWLVFAGAWVALEALSPPVLPLEAGTDICRYLPISTDIYRCMIYIDVCRYLMISKAVGCTVYLRR